MGKLLVSIIVLYFLKVLNLEFRTLRLRFRCVDGWLGDFC